MIEEEITSFININREREKIEGEYDKIKQKYHEIKEKYIKKEARIKKYLKLAKVHYTTIQSDNKTYIIALDYNGLKLIEPTSLKDIDINLALHKLNETKFENERG